MAACTICALGVTDLPDGTNVALGKEYGVSESSVRRHRAHLSGTDAGDDRLAGMTLRGATIREADGSYYRYAATSSFAETVIEDFNAADLLNRLDRAETARTGGSGAFVVSLNDIQLGKDEGGGSNATVLRVKSSVQKAIKRVEDLRAIGRDLGTLVIIGGGDMVEGCTIYPNQSYNLDLHRHDQIVGVVELILYTIDQLSGLFENTQMLVTKGNHGENRINGKKTHAGDNDDTLVFKMAKSACDRDPSLKHIEWTIAEGHEEYAVTSVAGWTLGTTHGDVFGKSPGANAKKAWEWYKNMSAGGFPVGEADVLITHHFHHEESADWGRCYWRQTRAQDGGSKFFESMTGQYSSPGMLSFVMTPEQRFQDVADL